MGAVYRISNAKLHLTIKTTLRYLQGKKPLPVKSAPAKNECSKKRSPHTREALCITIKCYNTKLLSAAACHAIALATAAAGSQTCQSQQGKSSGSGLGNGGHLKLNIIDMTDK